MKSMMAIALFAALITAAPGVAAQRCDYGPNSTSLFATAAGSQQEARVAPRAGSGSIGFRYEWRDVVIQRDTRPSAFPLVSCVVVGSSAGRAGLRPGDVILSVNGRDPRQQGAFAGRTPGSRWVLRTQRGYEEREISFVIDPSPTVGD